jgi:hypothetical protein
VEEEVLKDGRREAESGRREKGKRKNKKSGSLSVRELFRTVRQNLGRTE